MEDFLKHIKKNNYSKNTIITYRNILKIYIPIWADIRSIRKRLMEYLGNPNTIWTHYNTICTYMTYTKDKRLSKIREIKLPPIPKLYRPVFTKAFLLRKTNDQSKYKNIVIRFLFETGLRASEISNIIEVKKDTLIVKGKGDKIREIFHNKETTLLFNGFNFSTKTLRLWVKEVLGTQYTPHSIRRSHATHMLLSGANPKTVMMQLGHSKVETTYQYLQLSKSNNLKIYNKHF